MVDRSGKRTGPLGEKLDEAGADFATTNHRDVVRSSAFSTLANFYGGVVVLLCIVFGTGLVIAVIGLVLSSSDQGQIYMMVLLGVSISGVVGVGASSVLLDIMYNVREINKKMDRK